MAITRSMKLRRNAPTSPSTSTHKTRGTKGSAKKTKAKGSSYVSYRGLLHGAMMSLALSQGRRLIPEQAYRDEMVALAAKTKKQLPRRMDWLRAYCAVHIQEGIDEEYFCAHEGGALTVTPKARYRYRNVQKMIPRAVSEEMEAVMRCQELDKELAPPTRKSKAELLADNRALTARLNSIVDQRSPSPSPESPLTPLFSSPATSLSELADMDVDIRQLDHDTKVPEPECGRHIQGSCVPSTPPVAGSSRMPYPSPESIPRRSLPRTTRSPTPGPSFRPATPSPIPVAARTARPPKSMYVNRITDEEDEEDDDMEVEEIAGPLPSPFTTDERPVVRSTVRFEADRSYEAVCEDQGSEGVLTLDVPGPCSLTLRLSAASLECRIVELERELESRDEIISEQKREIARLHAERDELASIREQLHEEMGESAVQHEDVVDELNERIAAREEQIAALEATCFAERTRTNEAQQKLESMQQECTRLNNTLSHTSAQITTLASEKDGLQGQIAELERRLEGAQGTHRDELRDVKEEHEVQMHLLRAMMEEQRAKRDEARARAAALLECLSN